MTELTYYKTITLYTRIIKGQEGDKKKILFVSNDRINVLQNHLIPYLNKNTEKENTYSIYLENKAKISKMFEKVVRIPTDHFKKSLTNPCILHALLRYNIRPCHLHLCYMISTKLN